MKRIVTGRATDVPAPSQQRSQAPAAFACALGILAVLGGIHGLEKSVDTAWFVNNGVIIWNWLLGAGNGEIANVMDDGKAYILPSLLLGGAKLLAGSNAWIIVVAAQMLMYAFVVALCFRLWEHVADPPVSRGAWLLAGLVVVFGLVDVPAWVFWQLTDVTFLALVATFLFCLVEGFRRRAARYLAAAGVLALLGMVTRPTGVCLPFVFAGAVVFMALYRRTGSLRMPVTICIVLPVLVIVFVAPWLVHLELQGVRWSKWLPASGLRGSIRGGSRLLAEGVVVDGRPELSLGSAHGYWSLVQVVLHRLFFHYVPFRSTFSVPHTVLLAVYFPVMLALVALALARMRTSLDRYLPLLVPLVLSALYFGLLHGVTLLAFSWRYQLPATLSFWLLAGCGCRFLLARRRQ